MRFEPDLKTITYVWVDALCVNQTNYERRKATIHQMSTIYERATYILAVPDLHKQHLTNVLTASAVVMDKLEGYRKDIYHLIQGNTAKLIQLDNEFLDKIDVPKDQVLRQLVTKYNHWFTDELSRHPEHPYNFEAEIVGEELNYISQDDSPINHQRCQDATTGESQTQTDRYASFERLFDEIKVEKRWNVRSAWHGKKYSNGYPMLPWKNYVFRRNNDIAQAMSLLNDLIKDWASRVWVISEYHMAKKKNNLKYWFIGLSDELAGLPFFTFDFGGSAILNDVETRSINREFHEKMIKQLDEKTFFEKILDSKASKNEDRFYAILPQSKYKDKINQVGEWKIDTMTSVRLQLFKFMDTKDKLVLLFMIGYTYYYGSKSIFPTFATSTIEYFSVDFEKSYPPNFDLSNQSTITIHHRVHDDSQMYYYLQLTPKKYYVARKIDHKSSGRSANIQKEIICNHFQLNEHNLEIDTVRIPFYDVNDESHLAGPYNIYLFGSFSENIWIYSFYNHLDFPSMLWDYYDNDDLFTVFNIY
ncbi:hypothetical protein BCR42DRAFT_426082 [Absidia repens]|uniref:Heterokaryon incompatibility domain-containing protein n=1 Tax=Absidia repens TaxID=90262 RepID=A0A1X2I1Q2_9FUNG|nr:hypothetical protein BCR42DRAFT_426082 [Absidia repens]